MVEETGRIETTTKKILSYDIIEQNEYCKKENVLSVSLKELLIKSDIITLHTPLTPLTKGMVNHSFLSCMKKDSYLINTARGQIVVSEDLKNLLMLDC